MEITKQHKEFFQCSEKNNVFLNAAAGSGKTTTLVYLAKLYSDKKILFLSFNRFIALELKEKIKNQTVSTIHSLAYKSIKLIEPNSSIVCKEKKQSLNTLSGFVNEVYSKYKNKDLKVFSFNELLAFGAASLRNNYKSHSLHYDYIFIDEFQDLSDLQILFLFEFIKFLNKKPRIICTGDINQCIYQFSGISKKGIYKNLEKLDVSKIVSLPVTYRCPSSLTSLVSSLKSPFYPINMIPRHSEGSVFFPETISAQNLASSSFVLSRTRKELLDLFIESRLANLNSYFIDSTLLQSPENWTDLDAHIYNYLKKFLGDSFLLHVAEKQQKNAINFMTIHKSKGLQSENVYILNMENFYKNQLSHYNYKNKEKQWEGNNLFYVAATRTKQNLYMVEK